MSGGSGVRTVDGRRVAYRRAGTEGPPVMLLHGGGIDDATVSWHHAIDALAEDFQVYAPDWPGYGDSEDGIEHSVDAYRSVLGGFLDSIGLDSVSLVGISMGGAVALGYALTNPDRVERLCLVDSYGLAPRVPGGTLWRTTAMLPGLHELGWATAGTSHEAARFALGAVVADPASLEQSFVEDFRRRASEPGAGAAFDAFLRSEITVDGRVRTNFLDELGDVSVPTLLLHGAEDPLFPPAWSVRAAAQLPNGAVELLADCGHWPPRERPERFNAVLGQFLRSSTR